MINNLPLIEMMLSSFILLAVLVLWELIWKGLALYRAGKKQQPWWFFFLLIINSLGILPIIYLIISRDKKKKRK